MRKIWLAFIVFAIYGSLWPFHFMARPLDGHILLEFLASADQPYVDLSYGLRDLLANIVLFVPIGLFGVLDPHRSSLSKARVAWVIVSGMALAVALQVAQLFAEGRVPDLNDVWWNGAGIVLGLFGAWLFMRWAPKHYGHALDLPFVPAVILGAWAAYRLARFYPSLKLATLIEGVQPLFDGEAIDPLAVAHDTIAWLIAAVVLRHLSAARIDRFLGAIMLAMFTMEIIVERNVLTPSDLLAGLLALLLWHGWLSGRDHERPVLLGLIGYLLLDGLWPMTLRSEPLPIVWLPFSNILQLNPMRIFLNLSDLLFMLGGLAYLLRRTLTRPWVGVATVTAVLFLLQIVQHWTVGHVPDMAAPLILACSAVAFAMLEKPAHACDVFSGNDGKAALAG